jgi:D-sedoheptulose 7-phosphate isomerase
MIDKKIIERVSEHHRLFSEILENKEFLDKIELIARKSVESYRKGGKLVCFGNGGSASDAQHIVGELVNKFYFNRPMLNALALNTNTTVMTAIANDISYDDIFSRQVEHLVDNKDIVIGLSTSGNSVNVIKAVQAAKNKGALTIAFTGKNGGKLRAHADIVLDVPSDHTPRIQEVHITVGHIICEIIEQELFGGQR